MKSKYLIALLGITLAAMIGFAGNSHLQRLTSVRSNPTDGRYSTDIKELRRKFNADKGKVRLLMLLSPT